MIRSTRIASAILAATLLAVLISTALTPPVRSDSTPQELIRRLSANDTDMRKQAQDALVKLGASAVEPLITFLDEPPDYDAKLRASDALVRIGKPAIKPLIKTLSPAEGKYPGGIGNGILAEIGRPAVEALIAALHDPSQGVRAGAMQTLAAIGDPRAIDPLIAVLNIKNETFGDINVLEGAAEALSSFREPRVVAALEATAKRSEYAGGRAVYAMGFMGKLAVPTLIKLMKDPMTRWQWDAVQALQTTGDARAIPPMMAILRDPKQDRDLSTDRTDQDEGAGPRQRYHPAPERHRRSACGGANPGGAKGSECIPIREATNKEQRRSCPQRCHGDARGHQGR